MVTPQGFNALLKLVEEPPEHVKFIFATTEPDKVLGTIRSRTHHYPFRLVPPAPMLDYVQQLCDEEGVTVEPGVLSLVVRAGGGSPRDTLSLLDQLIAGSEGATVGYERAVALLGYTHGSLLDEVVDAIGAADAPAAFAAADRVMQTGQDPRRFVEDLLERLRDLIVVAATSPESAAAVLRGVPDDELVRMGVQASAFGPAELSRVADLVNQTLTEMTGATSPRLHLELMLARVLVPASDATERGALARVERLERRVGVADPAASAATEAAAPADAGDLAASTRPAGSSRPAPAAPAAPAPDRGAATPAASTPGPAERDARPAPAKPEPVTETARPKPVGPVTVEQVRDAWPEVLSVLERTKRTAWMAALTAKVLEYRTDESVLVLGFPSQNDVSELRGATGAQSPAELLRRAIADVLGVQVRFIPRVVDGTSAEAAEVTGGAGSGPAGAPSAAASPASGGKGGGGGSAPASDPGSPAASAPAASTPAVSASGGATATADAGSARSTGPGPAGPAAATPSTPAAGASTASVDSWATVAIPASDPAVEAPTQAAAPARTATATAVAERTEPASARQAAAGSASRARSTAPVDDVPPPDDADAPPPDDERDFAPGPEPVDVSAPAPAGAAARPAGRAARGPARAGTSAPPIQRYGEAVVRDLLGATFLEEVEAPPTARFGERG